jgi:rsbT co-antagonist protein RsbR
MGTKTQIADIVSRHEADLLTEWIREQMSAVTDARRQSLMKESELREQSTTFLRLMRQALQVDPTGDIDGPAWGEIRDLLASITRSRGLQGFTPSETATFIFSFKQPLFARLRTELSKDPAALAEDTWRASLLLDRLGLHALDIFQRSREEVIARQQQEMLELSTPVVKLWDGVLALPLIGTLDSARTQIVMESLLQRIVETGSEIAIVDITGVPTVDTLVAQHLIKTVTAARLMGAECIISGIRPQIAQTIVHLGVDLGSVSTKSSLADAFSLALRQRGLGVGRVVSRAVTEVKA